MNSHYSSHHWIPIVVVVAVALLTLGEARGQRTDSSAVFEGRPAMAGANGGTGAMAGPPQGGIGVQGQDQSEIALRHRMQAASSPIAPRDRDTGMAKNRESVAQRAKNAIKRLIGRSKHGSSGDDIRTAGQ